MARSANIVLTLSITGLGMLGNSVARPSINKKIHVVLHLTYFSLYTILLKSNNLYLFMPPSFVCSTKLFGREVDLPFFACPTAGNRMFHTEVHWIDCISKIATGRMIPTKCFLNFSNPRPSTKLLTPTHMSLGRKCLAREVILGLKKVTT